MKNIKYSSKIRSFGAVFLIRSLVLFAMFGASHARAEAKAPGVLSQPAIVQASILNQPNIARASNVGNSADSQPSMSVAYSHGEAYAKNSGQIRLDQVPETGISFGFGATILFVIIAALSYVFARAFSRKQIIAVASDHEINYGWNY